LGRLKLFSNGRVFVVDEPTVSSTLATILRLHDFAATAFADGIGALNAARSEAPDLLIAEVAMSPLSGVDLAHQLRKRCPGCKVLLFAGPQDSSASLEIARSNGLEFEVIPKAIGLAELITRVRDIAGASSNSAAKTNRP
jgi:DNA-binding response OmpR family regulator